MAGPKSPQKRDERDATDRTGGQDIDRDAQERRPDEVESDAGRDLVERRPHREDL